MFAAHRAESEDEESSDESDDDDEEEDSSDEDEAAATEEGGAVDAVTTQMAASAVDDQAAGSESDEDGDAPDLFDPDHERIKRQVQKDRQARQKGGRRRSRNNAKLSIKGRLVHKDQW